MLSQASAAKVTRTIATANGGDRDRDRGLGFERRGRRACGAACEIYQAARQQGQRRSANFYNPADPKRSMQIFRTEQVTDITRNATTNPPDRVAEFTYKAAGGKFAALFDGSEKALSWDSQPVYSRIVGTP